MVDLHTRSGARVSRVHILGDAGPDGGGADNVALGTAAVPPVDLVAGGVEAARANAGVDGSSCEKFGVCGCHDVLMKVSYMCSETSERQWVFTVIMAPELLPVTNTLLVSASY